MEELTIKDIKKAVRQLKKYGGCARNLYMSESRAKQIILISNEHGIKTKGEDGNDYILGMKIVTRTDLNDKTCYISDY